MSTAKNCWQAAWLRGGRISEAAWIGQDTLAWCSDLRLVFLDVPTNKLRLPRFPNDVLATGACCLSGHLTRQVFAFAQRKSKPRLYVYVYPSMKMLCECIKGTYYAYLATVFTGDYVVSLSSMPEFNLTVWSWRNGNKIATISTIIRDADDYGQTLRANFVVPKYIAQIGNRSGRLCTWKMTICGTASILSKNEIFLPAKKALVRDAAWCPDSSDILAICDRDGHIYLSDSNGKEVKRVVISQRCGFCVEIEPAAICWCRGGIVLRTTFCQIRYYRKNENDLWRKCWYTKNTTFPCVLMSHPYRNDRLFFMTKEGHVVQIHISDDATEAILDTKHFINGRYKYIDFVHPWEDHIVAIDVPTELTVVDAHEGVEVAKVNLEINANITCMISHPDYPLIIISSDEGEVIFLSLLVYDSPKILGKYKMQRETLDLMKFSSSGRYLAVCQKDEGICYFFNVSLEQSIDIITRLDSTVKIADILLFETETGLKFCLLQGTSSIVSIGYQIFLYDLPNGHKEFKKLPNSFSFANFFQRLHYIPGEPLSFITTPYLSKQLKYFKISDWKEVTCYNVTPNAHKVRQVRIFTSKKWLITTSIDGLITIRIPNARASKNMHILTHHRRKFGIAKAIFNSRGDLLIALGSDGSLVAMKHFESEEIPQDDDKFKNLYEFGQTYFEDNENQIAEYIRTFDTKQIQFLSEPIPSFLNSKELHSLTWVEWKARQKMEEESKRYATEREKIISKFTTLKNKVIDLLNKNETCSEIKKLPISAFALDKLSREKKMKVAKDEREEVKLELESNCLDMERVTNWIQTKFWEPQKVLAQSIFGIFDETEVTNYTIFPQVPGLSDFYDYALFTRSVISELTNEDTIYPWEIRSESELNLAFNELLKVKKTDEVEKLDTLIENEEQHIDIEEEYNRRLLEGTTTYQFIEPCAKYFSQFKIYAFDQVVCDSYNIKEDTKRLRLHFNKQFNDMYTIKEREMNLVRERIDRLLHMSSELRVMFNETVAEVIEYPEWHMKEKPETIVKVEDSELSSKIYISPSQQEILDRQAAEAERIRQAMLADDFRERAIQAMMDGLLEVRWEDLIKKDVPKPECMLIGKSPGDYTDDDALAVKRYEQDVRNLEAEREKYRKILHSSYVKISGALREAIENFNSRFQEFHLLKMKIESAILQLNLRFVRYYVRHVHRLEELHDDDKIKKNISEKYELIKLIKEDTKIIQNSETELHNQYESLNAKDKTIEKRLKNEFHSLGKNAFAAIVLQFKRRPRIVLKTTSPHEVLDLGKSITSMNKLPYLSTECLEYIKHLEVLDIRPQNLPHSIEKTHWENLVALRRLKIDHEMKQRSVGIELEEATRVLAYYTENLNKHRLAIESMRAQLMSARSARIERELNAELQLVLKMGHMEIPTLRGSVTEDWPGAVLVPRADIDEVNGVIVAVGKEKLKSIERTLHFRKGIVVEAWEHQCLETKIKHLEVDMYYVRSAHMTRGIQEYLRRKAKGQKDDKTAQRMDKELRATRRNQEKMLKDWERKLDEVSNEVMRIMRKNELLDSRITKLNVDRCEMELKRDLEGEQRQKDFRHRVDKLIAERASVLRKLLKNYEELLEIRREHDYCDKLELLKTNMFSIMFNNSNK